MRMQRILVGLQRLTPALAIVAAAACADSLTGPGDELLLVQDINLDELARHVEGAARVDVTLYENGPVARRVVVKTGDELGGEEWLLGAVSGITAEGDAGVLALAFGVHVAFDVETEIVGLRGDVIGFDGFVAHVTEALALGREPRIKAVRRAADAPQAPDDPSFRAVVLRLTDDAVRARLVLNADADNFARHPSPPPDGYLTLLNLPIELWVSAGRTELILDRDERREVAFEGIVRRVDAAEGVFVLHHGDREIVVRVLRETKLGFNETEIASLEPVARALEAGLTVRARGEGILHADRSGVILAIVVRFKTDDGREGVHFGGQVAAFDLEAGTFTLVEGPTIVVGPETRLKVNGEPIDGLARVAAAHADGLKVFAFGEGTVEPGSDRILAVFVRFEVDDGRDIVEFVGRVRSVTLEAGTFQIVEGPAIKVTDQTTYADGSALTSLAAVAEALEGGLAVFVSGCGTVLSREPPVIAANVLKFRVED